MPDQPTIPSIQTNPTPPISGGGLRPAKLPVRHHRLRWTLVSISALVLLIVITGGWLVYRAISVVNTTSLNGSNSKLSFFQQLTRIVSNNDELLKGENEGRVNILLLGIGGPGHDGPYLTDTIIVASVKPSTKDVALLSIPRDLVVNIPGYDYRKINNVLSIGRDSDYPGGGEALVVKVVSDFLDQPIQYYARVDFKGFEEVIDRLGGITVNVETAFTDREYPDNNYGYQTVRFQAGKQTMDGETALEFARSRHGNNGEGSDFARAARQQKIIVATRDQAMSLGTLLNPVKMGDLLGSIAAHHQTNMEAWELIRLAKLIGSVDQNRIISKVLDNSPTGFLHNSTGIGGAYILEPNDKTLGDIRFLAQNIFLIGEAEREHATILVANATSITGLADAASRGLGAFGLSTLDPFSLRSISVEQTVLIDTSQGKYPKTLELVGLYKRARGSITLTTWKAQTADETLAEKIAVPAVTNTNRNTNQTTSEVIDIVLILGQDQPQLQARGNGTRS